MEGSDPWRGAVDRYLTELPEKYTPASNPERAVDALTTQLRSDAPVDAAQIVRVSLATRDPAPWRALAERPASERTATVTQWVAQMPAAELTAPLARAVADARPPEVATAAWCRLLLDAMRERPDRAELAELLEQTLLGDDVDLTLRASSWTGLVQAWLESGDTEAAVRCFSSPVAERISLEGNARALTYPWVALPPACRDELSLHRLLDIIAVSQDSDRAIASIYGALKGSSPELVLAMLDRWAAVCADESRQGPPDLLAGLTSEERRAWARGVVGPDPMPDALVALIGQIAQGVHAVDIWRTAESAWSEKHASAPRDSLIWCIAAAVSGAPVAERLARELLHEVVARTPFPDADLADAAGVVAAIGDASPLWMWVAATAAEPRQFDDATLDATVVAFCEYPPTSPADREAAIRCAELLGAGPGWEPLDLARWVVRVAMAPHADDLPLLLLISLVQGLASRDDGPTWVAAVTSAMIGLHSEHPALQLYLQDVLPHAWPDAPPAGTASLVSLEGIDTVVADLVVAALGG